MPDSKSAFEDQRYGFSEEMVSTEVAVVPDELLNMAIAWLESVGLSLQGMDYSKSTEPLNANQETSVLLYMRCYHLLDAAKKCLLIYPDVTSILTRVILENTDRILYLILRAKEKDYDASSLFDKEDKKGTPWENMRRYIEQHGPERYQQFSVANRRWLSRFVHSGDLNMYQKRDENGKLSIVLGAPSDAKYQLNAVFDALVAGISVVQIQPYMQEFVAETHIGMAEIYADAWSAPAVRLTNVIHNYLVHLGQEDP